MNFLVLIPHTATGAIFSFKYRLYRACQSIRTMIQIDLMIFKKKEGKKKGGKYFF